MWLLLQSMHTLERPTPLSLPKITFNSIVIENYRKNCHSEIKSQKITEKIVIQLCTVSRPIGAILNACSIQEPITLQLILLT